MQEVRKIDKKLYTKFIIASVVVSVFVTFFSVNILAEKVAKPSKISMIENSKIRIGQSKSILSTRMKTSSTNSVKFVRFLPSNTKNIGIIVKSLDQSIVSVEKVSNIKYKYTGVKEGRTWLIVKSRSKNSAGKRLKCKMLVDVTNPFMAMQTGAYTFKLRCKQKIMNLDKTDIKVTQLYSSVDNSDKPVKYVKLSSDRHSADVRLELPFNDRKEYEISYGPYKEYFRASVGAPSSLWIRTRKAVVNKPTPIEFVIIDANGMDVTGVQDPARISVEVKAGKGRYDELTRRLTFKSNNEKATVKVVYHTWIYDARTGQEIIIQRKVRIDAVDR